MFGFGQKQIEVVLDNLNFSQGDTIKGKVVLTLKKPTHGKALKVGLSGEKTVTQMSSRSTNRYIEPVFNFEMPLDGEKDYSKGEYNFEIKIPSDLIKPKSESLDGDVVGALKFVAGRSESSVRWYVKAKIDIPMRPDINNRVQINIG